MQRLFRQTNGVFHYNRNAENASFDPPLLSEADRLALYLGSGSKPNVLTLHVLGGPQSGKRSIVVRYIFDGFIHSYDPTDDDTSCKQIKLDGHRVFLNFVRMSSVTPSLLSQIETSQDHYLLLTYHVSKPESFLQLKTICSTLRESKLVPKVVLATAIDIPDHVSDAEGNDLAREIGAGFVRVSALTGEGCGQQDLVSLMIKLVLQNVPSNPLAEARSSNRYAKYGQLREWLQSNERVQVKVLGSRGSGKRRLIQRLTSDVYSEDASHDELHELDMEVFGRTMTVSFDLSDDVRVASPVQQFHLLTYRSNDRSSFEYIKHAYTSITTSTGADWLKAILVETAVDVPQEPKMFKQAEDYTFAQTKQLELLRTSAKLGQNCRPQDCISVVRRLLLQIDH